MNRDRMLVGLGGALIVALLASGYVYRQLKTIQQTAPGRALRVGPMVVAAGPLKLGQRLAATDLALLDWPEGKRPTGALSSIDAAVGRALVVPLVGGEAVLDQELAMREGGSGLPVAIPEGMRAVSVGVDEVVAVAGFVTPNTLVDVLVTGTGNAGPLTRTILEHVRVLAVGQELQTEAGKPQSAPVVTLLVEPEDAQKLTLAAAQGKIHLSLRNTSDTADVNPPPVYGSSIFLGEVPVAGSFRRGVAPKPAPPPAPFTVQVIRGDKVETQSFPR